jgi:hypothetical protein
MRGTVRAISAVNGLLAIETARGEYTIAEPIGVGAAVGDVLEGDLRTLGRRALVKVTTGRVLRVAVHDGHADAARVRELLESP